MPHVFDNIENDLLSALNDTIENAFRADFCVGYFNLRGWGSIADAIEPWAGGEDNRCRVLVGMQSSPEELFHQEMRLNGGDGRIDNAAALRLKKRLAAEFREQLTIGTPTNADEAALQQLARQLRAGKVVVKLFLRHKLHAKLYLLYREDKQVPIVGYLGSSNLTLAGLSKQGELNVDVVEQDAAEKLEAWFQNLWDDDRCVDISDELAEIIESSWAGEDPIPPYHLYVKMAYHLSQEARTGLDEFNIPKELDETLFDYQKAAVKIAAHHLHKRGGVLIGDVVGLGKSLMATALARIFEDDMGLETLIISPKNLVRMWEEEDVHRYGLRARVLSITQVIKKLPDLRRYRLVIIDESHNLRNREGKRYRAIQEYLTANDSRCILLSATPYNKTYQDLSNQLRLFIPEEQNLGIRPEQYLREIGEMEFSRRHQAGVQTLAAFEKSGHADDWRELMRLFMVRRTRSFIKQHYAEVDPANNRRYLSFPDGRRSYFPRREPRTLKFHLGSEQHADQYAQLYDERVVDVINKLELPRYGLGQYVKRGAEQRVENKQQGVILNNLSLAGRRLMGFSRTNLFKRLESSGEVFLLSLERHILRNYVYLHALENGLPLPIGTQDVAMMDTRFSDADVDAAAYALSLFESEVEDDANGDDSSPAEEMPVAHWSEQAFKQRAVAIYHTYTTDYATRFNWLPAMLFQKKLGKHLKQDAQALIAVLQESGAWRPAEDAKLNLLVDLLTQQHPQDKVIVFTQFADTVHYLERELKARGVERVAGVTGGYVDPTSIAYRFSPRSNNRVPPAEELRVVIATDVLSEGQNLQDAAIVVNYDLPWAIIRLIQRAGRVDRIGQQADTILSYTFLPAEGVDRVIHLRDRVQQRLAENAEVVGTDETFFEDDAEQITLLNLYNEQAGILEEAEDDEVDLASYAYQIWQDAIGRDPSLERLIPKLAPVSFSARAHIPNREEPEGVLVHLRTHNGYDTLAWVDPTGEIASTSQFAILNAARCAPETPALPRADYHHDAVQHAVTQIMENQRKNPGGQLGRPSGARFRVYTRLQAFAERQRGTLFEDDFQAKGLFQAVEDIYNFPLRQAAVDTLNRQLRVGIADDDLAELVMNLRAEERLCIRDDGASTNQEPRLICSIGLYPEE